MGRGSSASGDNARRDDETSSSSSFAIMGYQLLRSFVSPGGDKGGKNRNPEEYGEADDAGMIPEPYCCGTLHATGSEEQQDGQDEREKEADASPPRLVSSSDSGGTDEGGNAPERGRAVDAAASSDAAPSTTTTGVPSSEQHSLDLSALSSEIDVLRSEVSARLASVTSMSSEVEAFRSRLVQLECRSRARSAASWMLDLSAAREEVRKLKGRIEAYRSGDGGGEGEGAREDLERRWRCDDAKERLGELEERDASQTEELTERTLRRDVAALGRRKAEVGVALRALMGREEQHRIERERNEELEKRVEELEEKLRMDREMMQEKEGASAAGERRIEELEEQVKTLQVEAERREVEINEEASRRKEEISKVTEALEAQLEKVRADAARELEVHRTEAQSREEAARVEAAKRQEELDERAKQRETDLVKSRGRIKELEEHVEKARADAAKELAAAQQRAESLKAEAAPTVKETSSVAKKTKGTKKKLLQKQISDLERDKQTLLDTIKEKRILECTVKELTEQLEKKEAQQRMDELKSKMTIHGLRRHVESLNEELEEQREIFGLERCRSQKTILELEEREILRSHSMHQLTARESMLSSPPDDHSLLEMVRSKSMDMEMVRSKSMDMIMVRSKSIDTITEGRGCMGRGCMGRGGCMVSSVQGYFKSSPFKCSCSEGGAAHEF